MTKEERAKVCVEQFNYPLYESNFVERGYIKGAEEQHNIDIDKSCEWLKEYVNDYRKFDGGINVKEMIKDFCKAMEE